MKCSKLIAVLLLGVMMFGTIQPACAITVGECVGATVSVVCYFFGESVAIALQDPSMASFVEQNYDTMGEATAWAVDGVIDWVASWF